MWYFHSSSHCRLHLRLENFKVPEKVPWECVLEPEYKSWCLTDIFPLTSVSPPTKSAQKPFGGFKCVLAWEASPSKPHKGLQIFHAQTHLSGSLIIPRAQTGRAGPWILNAASLYPFPNDKPLPPACSETGTKTMLGAPTLPTPSLLSLSHPLPRPQWALSFSHAWHLTKLSPLGPFSCDIFPAYLLLVNMIQDGRSFKVRDATAGRSMRTWPCTHTHAHREERKTWWKGSTEFFFNLFIFLSA